jgi:hypothetical protein
MAQAMLDLYWAMATIPTLKVHFGRK